jgi:hypothetical protein
MALIICPECGQEVSDRATACPKCGHPFSNVTVQLTNKKWKIIKLVSVVLMVVGGLMLLAGGVNGGLLNPLAGAGFSILFISLPMYIFGQVGAWWSNK